MDNDFERDLEALSINPADLYHVILMGGPEFIAEKVHDEDSNEHTFLNPVKIIRDVYIDQDGNYDCNNIFVEWNPCLADPFISINPALVITMGRPNQVSMEHYISIVKEQYFQMTEKLPDEVPMVNESNGNPKRTIGSLNNVIDFMKYVKSTSKT